MKKKEKHLRNQNIYIVILALLVFLYLTKTCMAQVPGQSYFDNTAHIEYIHGDYPVIISVPHGGYATPNNITDRNCGGCIYQRDSFTQEMSRTIFQEFHNLTGHYPYMIINLLDRSKLDTNRDIIDGADGDPIAEEAWNNYQDFIESAKADIVQNFGRGLLIDLHGHGHPIQRVELGYILTEDDLNETDQTLNNQFYINRNSTKNLIHDNVLNLSHSELLRGPLSFGSLLVQKGYPAVPSESDPFLGLNDPYFNGGYNVFEHGAWNNDEIDAFQIECNQDIRFDANTRQQFSESAALSIVEYLSLHYGVGAIDFDNDGVFSDSDCNDFDSSINPSVNEVPYNGIDDDCNPGTLDDDLDDDGFDNIDDCDDSDSSLNPNTVWYIGIDNDNDGFFGSQLTQMQCDSPGIGYATSPPTLNDCDDSDSSINPGTVWYIGVDNDNDGFFGSQLTQVQCDSPGIGYATSPPTINDCDDSDSSINPGTVWYIGVDNDNDGFFGSQLTHMQCNSPGIGYATSPPIINDCHDSDSSINPSINEIPYNSIDDDCDPNTPDNDLDRDGFDSDVDCNDNNAAINPNEIEIPYNGIDDDCDPNTQDEGESDPSSENDEQPMEEMKSEEEEKESENDSIVIYPNPAGQYLNIEAGDSSEFQVDFFDLAERLVLTKRIKKKLIIESLASGVYILKFRNLKTGDVFVKKLIISN